MGKHYVPQEYLKGFALRKDPRLVWMFDKRTCTWACPAIKKAAQEPGYYSPEDEARLAELEKPGHIALRVLRAGQKISGRQRSDLAYYLAVLVMRGPQKRRKGEEIMPDALKRTVDGARDGLREIRTESNAERVDALLREADALEAQYRVEPPSSVLEQLRSPWPSGQIIASIRHMAWRVIRLPPARPVVTCDAPAHYFDSFGLGSDESEVTFAIDPYRVLLGSFVGQAGSTIYMNGRSNLAAEVNRRLTWGAERFVFSARRSSHVQALATRARARLKQINWSS